MPASSRLTVIKPLEEVLTQSSFVCLLDSSREKIQRCVETRRGRRRVLYLDAWMFGCVNFIYTLEIVAHSS